MPLGQASFESEPSQLKSQIESVLGEFSEIDQEIICFIFGIGDGEAHSNSDAMRKFNVDIEKIRELKASLLQKIQTRSL